MSKRPLGRGLGALLPRTASVGEEVREIEIDLIRPSEEQPRTKFNESRLQELAQSIKSNGIIQPLLVRRRDRGFELVAGERRWRAAQIAGVRSVPAIIRDIADEKLLELALIENIQRQELNPVEEANAYRRLIEDLNLSHDEVAQRVGRDRTFITNYLRVLKLPEDILSLVVEEKLTMGHARALLGLATPALMRKVARGILRQQWSVRETENRIRSLTHAPNPEPTLRSKTTDPNVRAAETKLRNHLGRQVRLYPDHSKPGGRLEIHYYDQSDLEHLYQSLLHLPIGGL